MPILEVVYAREDPLPRSKRRAFALEAVEIFREVLGTPPGRLQLVFYHLRLDDTLDGLRGEGHAVPEDSGTMQ